MEYKAIPFSPPDIAQEEIAAVVEVLKSGWITSGPKVVELEKRINEYLKVSNTVLVSSATSGMELILKVLNIGAGDEVITTPYTYAATGNVILHRGIKPTFVDVKKNSFLIDEEKLEAAITAKTRAIIAVDFAGVPVDYCAVREVLKRINREDIVLIADSAHSFGGSYKSKPIGSQFDFHVFSFHAVKNFTTAEGGAITFNDNNFYGKEDLYRELKVTSLHGQTKDALSKMKAGAWQYDIITDGFKCNMTDLQAAIGLAQLSRYEGMLEIREKLFNAYSEVLREHNWAEIPFSKEADIESSYHLYPLRIKGFKEEDRNLLIQKLAEKNIATNVHFKPLPMLSLYKDLGYSIDDYENAYEQYANEISLPIYSTLEVETVVYIAKEVVRVVEAINSKKL